MRFIKVRQTGQTDRQTDKRTDARPFTLRLSLDTASVIIVILITAALRGKKNDGVVDCTDRVKFLVQSSSVVVG